MNWILIVLMAGNIHFSKVMDDEASCTKLGDLFAQTESSYFCVAANTITETLVRE